MEPFCILIVTLVTQLYALVETHRTAWRKGWILPMSIISQQTWLKQQQKLGQVPLLLQMCQHFLLTLWVKCKLLSATSHDLAPPLLPVDPPTGQLPDAWALSVLQQPRDPAHSVPHPECSSLCPSPHPSWASDLSFPTICWRTLPSCHTLVFPFTSCNNTFMIYSCLPVSSLSPAQVCQHSEDTHNIFCSWLMPSPHHNTCHMIGVL